MPKNNLYFLIFFLLVMGCKSKPYKINTIALVTPLNYKGEIVIFFSQDTVLGDIQFRDGKHFFFVKNDGIFYTKLPIGEGLIENYTYNNRKLEKVYYASQMTIRNANDTSYQVIGGSFRGKKFLDKDGKSKIIKFLPFKAGLASTLKKAWEIEDAKIDSIYTNKNAILK